MTFDMLDGGRIRTFPLAERRNLLDIRELAVDPDRPPAQMSGELNERIGRLSGRIRDAREIGRRSCWRTARIWSKTVALRRSMH